MLSLLLAKSAPKGYLPVTTTFGKTLTAEARRLGRVLELAEAWRAVALLDEADVFLVKRSNDNLLRNAVTSIFLRHLEYYQGIFLLTTNRLTSLDQAFRSRVHFCFEYDNLDAEKRFAIWQRFVDKAKATPNVEVLLNENDLKELAARKLNGRQIKNCMSISQAVAAEKQKPVDMACVSLAISFAMTSWDDPNDENAPDRVNE
ncbi:hypothetical protein B0T17DRAFT_619989 [Bombardia bombarda]|uniref:ATPase AAA-type core domain-containing protein n=1 Tax=Bombardia bombarda TaxID=252184 RepID=A0AA40BVI8_9PEZI|nr:hypothetical protein B0T17DRAFT_619989 [Bombardia bombarda]